MAFSRSIASLAVALFLGTAAPGEAQYQFLGPSKCVACHDHDRQARKWQKEEPAQFGGKAHVNTRKQLDAPKSAGFAKAIGLADPYDLKGSCVKCHGTIFKGDVNAGVSCESCHGAASGYNDLHQVKGSYLKAVAAGMRDLREKPAVIAKTCVDCHVTLDKKLSAAGHPAGEKFDAGASLQKLVHWNTTYNYAAVSGAARPLVAARLGGGAGRPPTGAPSPAPGGTTAQASPGGAKPPGPQPSIGATAAPPPSLGKPASAGPGSASKPSTGPLATTPPGPVAPATPPAPWDWDQVRPLPPDYKPEPIPESSQPAAPPAGSPALEVSPAPEASPGPEASPAPEGSPAAPPRPRPPRVLRRVVAEEPSLAEDNPLPKGIPGAPEAAATEPAITTPPGVQASASGPRPPAAQVAELRGKGVALLKKLLEAGARAPNLPAPAKPAEFRGPDSELLRLQDEVLALALEALRRP